MRMPHPGTHLAVRGENLDALAALSGPFDAVYIDPPYNTSASARRGYHDAYGDGWSAFLRARLTAARPLMAEHAALLLSVSGGSLPAALAVCDDVFGACNRLDMLVWHSAGQNGGRTAAGGVDYMLAYARDAAAHFAHLPEGRWRMPRPGRDEALAVAAAARGRGGSPVEVQAELRRWIARERRAGRIGRSVSNYNTVDADFRVYYPAPIAAPAHDTSPARRYPVTDPATGREHLPPPGRVWRWTRERMAREVAAGNVAFDPVRHKKYLAECGGIAPPRVFGSPRRGASEHLADLLGSRQFDVPKDPEVLARWLSVVTGGARNASVLDFFGGSGSTTEAVMRLNDADGGARRSVLVTNNEVAAVDATRLAAQGFMPGDPEWMACGVFERVTRPRLTTLTTGRRPDGTRWGAPYRDPVAFASVG